MESAPRDSENPYSSPASADRDHPNSFEVDDETPIEDEDYSSQRLLLTHVRIGGCNLLGLLHVFAVAAGLLVCVMLGSELPPAFFGGMVVGLLVALAAADLTLRLRLNPGSVLHRIFSSRTGGCLLWIPIWTIYTAIVLDQVVHFVLRRIA